MGLDIGIVGVVEECTGAVILADLAGLAVIDRGDDAGAVFGGTGARSGAGLAAATFAVEGGDAPAALARTQTLLSTADAFAAWDAEPFGVVEDAVARLATCVALQAVFHGGGSAGAVSDMTGALFAAEVAVVAVGISGGNAPLTRFAALTYLLAVCALAAVFIGPGHAFAGCGLAQPLLGAGVAGLAVGVHFGDALAL